MCAFFPPNIRKHSVVYKLCFSIILESFSVFFCEAVSEIWICSIIISILSYFLYTVKEKMIHFLWSLNLETISFIIPKIYLVEYFFIVSKDWFIFPKMCIISYTHLLPWKSCILQPFHLGSLAISYKWKRNAIWSKQNTVYLFPLLVSGDKLN